MVLSDRSLTNQKSGLSNSLNLTNQDFYVLREGKEKKTKKTIASLQAVPSPSLAHFDFPPSLSTGLLRRLPGDFKLCSVGFYVYFTPFINLYHSLGHYPSEGKFPKVILLFKKDNRQLKVNHRPVSLRESFFKICMGIPVGFQA